MRTTVTLDDDLVARLRDTAQEQGIPFKAAINEAIRSGLDHRAHQKRFRVKPRRMGPARVDVTKATELAARLEDEEIARKIRLGK